MERENLPPMAAATDTDRDREEETSGGSTDAPTKETAKKEGKKAGKKKAEKGGEPPSASALGPSVAAHPRAALNVARAKAWGGLAGFFLAGYLSLPTCTLAAAGARALVAGIVCYFVAWAASVFVWRHVVAAEHAGALARAAERRAPRAPAPPAAQGGRRSPLRGLPGGGTAAASRPAPAGRARGAAAGGSEAGTSEGAQQERGRPEPEFRRANVRVDAQRPVIAYVGADRNQVLTYTLDLSAGGMLVAGLDNLDVGDTFEFELTLDPDEDPITGAATVVRTANETCAVSFRGLGNDDEKRLVKYIFEFQRGEESAA